MYNLILKDVFHIKRYLWVAPAYAIFAMIALHSMKGVVLTASTVGIAYTFMLQACNRDDKNKSDLMLNSLPLLRRDIVLAKYFSIFIYAAVGMVSYYLVWAIMKGLGMQVSEITLLGLVGTLACVVTLSSIYFPLYFKLGYMKSNMFGMMIFFLFFFGPSLAARFVADFVVGTEFGKYIISFFAGINRQSVWSVPVLLLLMILVVMLVSYRISLRYYANREF